VTSSRNNNNSSVLLPELKGSLSPGQYHSNNSLIGKKQSLDRILRGIPTDNNNSSSIHRIYRKVFPNGGGPQQDGISRVSGISSDLANGGPLRNNGGSNLSVPLKIRPANINIYRVNNNNNANGQLQHPENILDIQGKSVIHK
jgi:hypothetical protein